MANKTIPNIPVLATVINDTDLFEKADGPAAGQSQRVPASLFKTYVGSTQNGIGSPVGAVTPNFAGQMYIDTDTPGLYFSTGVTDIDWAQLI